MVTKVIEKMPWMDGQTSEVQLYAMHQDQVTQLPEGADVYLTSNFCPCAGYVISDKVFAIQQHPEFTAALSKDLIERRMNVIGERSQAALDSLSGPHDGAVVGQWVANFLAPR